MKLLFLFLWRNSFSLLFIALELLAFYLLFTFNRFQNASILNSSNQVVAKSMESISYIREYINLRETNAELSRENAELRSRLPASFYQRDSLQYQVSDSAFKQQYTYVTARVVNNTINFRSNYLTLDKGYEEGVRPEMGVLSSSGVVGIVKQVSPHYCTVISLLHKDTRISAMIKKNRFFGSLQWDGGDPKRAVLREIDKTVPVSAGDTIVTTAYSSIFPAGVLLGVVERSTTKPGDNFQLIEVRLSTRFDNLTHVHLIKNLLKDEQRSLESNSPPNNEP